MSERAAEETHQDQIEKPEVKRFKHDIHDQVTLKSNGRTGQITARSEYAVQQPMYCVCCQADETFAYDHNWHHEDGIQ